MCVGVWGREVSQTHTGMRAWHSFQVARRGMPVGPVLHAGAWGAWGGEGGYCLRSRHACHLLRPCGCHITPFMWTLSGKPPQSRTRCFSRYRRCASRFLSRVVCLGSVSLWLSWPVPCVHANPRARRHRQCGTWAVKHAHNQPCMQEAHGARCGAWQEQKTQ